VIFMRNIFWHGVAEDEKIGYLKKFSVGIVGSRLLMEILWRSGIGCIRYIGDQITPVDVRIDASIKPLEANCYDVVHPMSHDTCIVSYLYPDEHSELRKQLKGVDLIIAHKYLDESAKIADELGSPFIPDFITTFLPDGISFFDVECPKVEHTPISYSLTCSFQAAEVMSIFTGKSSPAIAPEAYIVDLKAENYIRKIKLNQK